MQLCVNVVAIVNEKSQEYEQDCVDKNRNWTWVQHPHEQKTWEVEEKQLHDEKHEAITWLRFHVFDRYVDTFASISSSKR